MAAQLSIRPPIDWDYRPDDFFYFIDEGLVPAPFNKVAIQPSQWAARFKWDASIEPAEPPRSLAGLAARYWAKHPPAISDPEDQPGRRAREVDIARITIRSTLSDTTCVTAPSCRLAHPLSHRRRVRGRIVVGCPRAIVLAPLEPEVAGGRPSARLGSEGRALGQLRSRSRRSREDQALSLQSRPVTSIRSSEAAIES